jgi:Flp pilus assembly protein TadG
VALDRKVAITARTVADLASRMTTINNSSMSNILGASAAVVAPYSASQSYLSVTVSEASIDGRGNATITWSDALYSGGAHTVGQTITIPSQLAVPNTSLILGEVQYNYNPTFGYVLTGTMTLKSKMYMAPRLSSTVTRTNS